MRFSQQPWKIWTYGFVLLKCIVSKSFQPQCKWFLSRSSPSILHFSKNYFSPFFCLAFAKFHIIHFSSTTQKTQHKWGWMRDDDMKIIFFKKYWSAAFQRTSSLVFWTNTCWAMAIWSSNKILRFSQKVRKNMKNSHILKKMAVFHVFSHFLKKT